MYSLVVSDFRSETKGYVSISVASYVQKWAACSNCFCEASGSGREELELTSPVTYCPVIPEREVKESPDRKKSIIFYQIHYEIGKI